MLFDAIEYADMTYLMSSYYYVYDTDIHCKDRSKQVFGFALRKSKGDAENQNANEFGVFVGTIVYAYINS